MSLQSNDENGELLWIRKSKRFERRAKFAYTTDIQLNIRVRIVITQVINNFINHAPTLLDRDLNL